MPPENPWLSIRLRLIPPPDFGAAALQAGFRPLDGRDLKAPGPKRFRLLEFRAA